MGHILVEIGRFCIVHKRRWERGMNSVVGALYLVTDKHMKWKRGY